MNDTEEIQSLYQKYYEALINKDMHVLETILDETFELIHMTGMHQKKRVYMNAIADGTLNYRWCKHDAIPVTLQGDHAVVKGRTQVDAAVFGGNWHVWHLEQDIDLKKKNGKWILMRSVASTY